MATRDRGCKNGWRTIASKATPQPLSICVRVEANVLRLVAVPVSVQRISTQFGLIALLLVSLASCSNSPTSKALQDAFAADPRLNGSPNPLATGSPLANVQVQLPPKFPAEVPTYPNATLVEALSIGEFPLENSTELLTRWTSPDSSDRVVTFYREALQNNGWNLSEQPTAPNQGNFTATRNNLQLAVGVQPNGASGTNIGIETKTPDAQSSLSPNASDLQPGDPNFVGPISPGGVSAAPSASPQAALPQGQSFTDLEKAPQQLRPYATDLAQLGVLTPASNSKTAAKTFEPNKAITRGEYARWLVAANNRLYANRPARQIRLGVETAQPAFRDVSAKHPSFSAVQGLAEAGLIPSSLSGDSTAVLFRPDAPLSREDLILWKIPVDTRQALPTATIDAVKQTWGFQDAGRTDSGALRAVLADYQNGEQSNIRRAFGYTTLFQPKRPVTRAEAAAVLWYFGFQGDGVSAQEVLKGTAQG
ncbi:S-layer homology domain-containing protein [Myxacorys almedinensis]|uniref:S-layer homology domain-containing protein n=1 Tax=Myxacorys almedinensis A TaxID=2690445 RepID=A0A8J7YW61_9CYAN|nr:S-layer homology domain-containing protein [Myxacorys almedinensis]NDJ15719.1 S-layer homology domain-containing protein [Myxacorys almedinensis A]